jgi:hypothetical protein
MTVLLFYLRPVGVFETFLPLVDDNKFMFMWLLRTSNRGKMTYLAGSRK